MNISFNAEPGSIALNLFPLFTNDYVLSADPGSVSITGNFPVNIDAYIEANQWQNSKAFSFIDFSGKVDGLVSYWKLEAQVGNDFITLPMQYFKATMWNYRPTLPGGGANFVELSIPNASEFAETIELADSFRIKRFFVLQNGTTFDYVFFNFANYEDQDIELQFVNRLNQNSCIIKSAFKMQESVGTFPTRTLKGIRSNSSTAQGVRVTCTLDTNLLPGMTVSFLDDEFVAETIVYSVSPNDQYLEVYSYSV